MNTPQNYYLNVLEKEFNNLNIYKENAKLIHLLNRYPRSVQEANKILGQISEFKFFQQFIDSNCTHTENQGLTYMCSQMRLEIYKENDIVFYEGDESNEKYYVILQGSVTFHQKRDRGNIIQDNLEQFQNKNQKQQIEEDQSLSRSPLKKQSSKMFETNQKNFMTQPKELDEIEEELSLSQLHVESIKSNNSLKQKSLIRIQSLEDEQFYYLENQEQLDEYQDLIKKIGPQINIYRAGEGFGEKALIDSGEKRSTTVRANSDLFLIIIQKVSFELISKKYNKLQKEKIEILKQVIPELANEYLNVIENIAYSFKDIVIQNDTLLLQEGSPTSQGNFYILKSGKCLVEKQ